MDKQLGDWIETLRGITPVELSGRAAPPAGEGDRSSVINAPIPADLFDLINQYCQQENESGSTVLLAVFYLLLYRYTGQPDLTVALPQTGHPEAIGEKSPVSLVNILLTRACISAPMTFRQLCSQVRETASEAFMHQDIPYSRLIAMLAPQLDSGRSPYAQILFHAAADPCEVISFDMVSKLPGENGRPAASPDLLINICTSGASARITLEYNSASFERSAMERMAGHYRQLIRSALANPDKVVSSLDMLTPAEWRQLEAWNDTRVPYLETGTIVDMFEAQVTCSSNKPALRMGDTAFSFQQLNERANQLACYLREIGVVPGSVVGLCIKRSVEAVMALLGILKAGAIYLPLDPTYPLDRLIYMLEDSGARVVVGQADSLSPLAGHCERTVSLDQEAKIIASRDTRNQPVALSPRSPFYILYTSGSTGHPKGVVGTHRATLNRFAWMWRVFPFAEGEVCCQKTALNFVDSVWELFGPLLRGIPSVIIPDETVKDPFSLVDALSRQGVTRIVLVPSLLKALLETNLSFEEKLPALKLWVSSGEVLPSDLVRQFQKRLPSARLINLYGSSEVAGDVTWYDVGDFRDPMPSIPIGRPIDNTSMYVLDSALNPLPVGITGEIYAGGRNLASGYHRRPDLTAEKFVSDPFHPDSGDRLYRTGDLGYFFSDGNLIYAGRKDHQVKIRGMRIELGEIENQLSQHPAIEECAVRYWELPKLGPALVAYTVTKADISTTVEVIRQHLRSKLPAYMLPDHFIALDHLPKLPNGKLDRKALPSPHSIPHTALRISEIARDALERQITWIWEDVLNTRPIGREDNFFDLGGHSLLAVKLLAKMQEEMGVKIPVLLVFQAPTISGMARAIRNGAGDIEWQPLVPIHPGGSNPPFFCIHGDGGGVTGYAALARCLGLDQPFYGLQAPGLDGNTQPLRSIEELAACYIQTIQSKVQPHGPYFLGGYCFGGLIAYEMARQLAEWGESTALLALLETYPQEYAIEARRFLLPRNFLKFLKNAPLWLMVERARRRRSRERMMHFTKEVYCAQNEKLPPEALGDKVDSIIYPGFYQVVAANDLASRAYIPKLYAGCVDVFRVQTYRFTAPFDEDLGWGKYALMGTRTHVVPGAHDDLFELPYVEDLAGQLKICIAQAIGGTKR